MKKLLPIAALSLASCTSTAPSETAKLANPASVYCTEQGGKVEMRKGASGETGYCHLPDGRVVEEWEFYRSQNKGGN